MRKFTTEDRSLPEVAERTRIESQSLQQVCMLTDWEDEEVDFLADMKVGEEAIFNGWIFVRRTQ